MQSGVTETCPGETAVVKGPDKHNSTLLHRYACGLWYLIGTNLARSGSGEIYIQ